MATDDIDAAQQFADYFASRYRAVRRGAYLLCGDWHWADDLAQLAFVRVAAGWHRIREPAALDAYMRTCLVRTYLSENRRMWRWRERSVADPPDAAGSAQDDAEAFSRRQAFAAALRQLPPRQRTAVILRYYEGLDVAAAAAALGCSEGTVKSQTARGLAKLRRLLHTEAPEETRLTIEVPR